MLEVKSVIYDRLDALVERWQLVTGTVNATHSFLRMSLQLIHNRAINAAVATSLFERVSKRVPNLFRSFYASFHEKIVEHL